MSDVATVAPAGEPQTEEGRKLRLAPTVDLRIVLFTVTGGRLLVVELLIPPGNMRSFAKSQDVNMLVNLTGRERTEAEYRALYAAAGFALTRTIPAHGEVHVIEGVAA